ncbi:MAG: double-strand break repair protein AddB, partial [Alphaproteobacteria bacterium]|nr:double-strand break repair protein AddB [Alphaproteobacteria bacterium]
HVDFAEALARDARGQLRLWAEDAGEAAAIFIEELDGALGAMPPMPLAAYPDFLHAAMRGRAVRPLFGRHPRLNIWGPLEARLQHADLVVLGGLNEGTWPLEPEADPWLSRPMRAALGLAPPERRIGLAAHDFQQAVCAPRVALTRATKVDGTPTRPSRWLLRLETAIGRETTAALKSANERYIDWQQGLDRVGRGRLTPIGPPAPAPAVVHRPRALSVTQIEAWMRDPYAIYARHVLKLQPLKPIDQEPGPAERGSFIHAALEEFVHCHPEVLPPDACAELVACGRRALGALFERPAVRTFWWPRFLRIARWFVATERERRHPGIVVLGELRGVLELPGPAGPFAVSATADRIECTAGGLVIVDYKSAAPPPWKDVHAGLAPQLPVEALIAAQGGFPGVPAQPPAALQYWRLTGAEPPGEIKTDDAAGGLAMAQTRAGLLALIAAFDRPETPYHARPRPAFAPRFSDYLHLERVKEWSAWVEEEA